MSKFKPKNKKKILPKLWAGGSISIYDDQANYGNDVAGVQRVTSTGGLDPNKDLQNSNLTRNQQPLMFAGQAPQSSGLNIDAGRFMDTKSEGSSGEGNKGGGMSANQAAGYAQAAGGISRAISAGSDKRSQDDFRTQQIQQQDAVMGAVGQMGPVGGVVQGVYNVFQGVADPMRQSAEAMDQQAAEKGQAKLKNKQEAQNMAIVGSFFDPFKAIQARSSYEGGWTDVTGEGYAKHLEEKEQQRLDELNRPKREAQMADMRNKLAYGTYTAREGGSYPTNAIPMHGNQGAWAVPLFPNGGTFQVDGPSHEQGGVVIPTPNGDAYEVEKEEVIKREPNADKILSDKLIDKSTGKTYALSQKPYEKLKEQVEKFKNDNAKSNAEELASVRFDEGYNKQEMEKSFTLVKRANFAHNAAGWKHEDGGYQPLSNPYKGMTIPMFQDGGPKGTKPLGYDDAIQIDPSKIPSNYNFTQRTTKDLGGGRTEVTSLYKAPVSEAPSPNNLSSGTKIPFDKKKWEKAVIAKLQAGQSPEDLKNQHWFGDEGVKEYSKYYKPLKTVITQEAPKQEAGLYGEKTIAGKLQPKGYAEQPWETYRTWPEAGKANVYTDVNYHQGKPIDVNKSFDSAGNFKPYYLNNNATGTYLQQQGTEMNRNPLPVLPGTETRNMMSHSVNRYGGMQKFDEGGEASLGYNPRTLAEQYKMQQAMANLKAQQNSLANQQPVQTQPSDGSENWQDMNSPEFQKETQDMLNRAYAANKAEGQKTSGSNNFDYNALNSGLGVLANSAGPLAYMMGEGKNYDRQQFYEYTPSELDFTPTERAYMARRRAVLNNVKNLAGGNSGTALSNIAAQNADLNVSEDNARREFANQMAGIRNQGKQFNIQNRYMVDDVNARNKGQALTNYYKSIGALGTNTAQGMKDYRMSEQERKMLPFIKQGITDPATLALLEKYMNGYT